MIDTALGFAVIFGAGFWIGRFKDAAKYEINEGEKVVNKAIKRFLPQTEFHLINNVTLVTSDGTTQIDQIVVSRKGIFVIETKHYSGIIIGTKDTAKWIHITTWDKRQFQNPLRQNHKHVMELIALLPKINKNLFHSLIIFSGSGHFKTVMPNNVIKCNQLSAYMRNFDDDLLTDDEVYSIIGRIQFARKAETSQTDLEHLEGLKNRFSGVKK